MSDAELMLWVMIGGLMIGVFIAIIKSALDI